MMTIEKAALAAVLFANAPPSLLNPAFKYTPSNKTNIAETFRRVRERMLEQSVNKQGSP